MGLRTKSYCINIPPIPWQRARLSGDRKHFFDGQYRDKVLFGIHLKNQHNDEPIFSKATCMDVTFYMPYPRSRKKIIGQSHYSKPDLDNLLKFLLDAISKDVLLSDDRIIYSLTAKKVYDDNPRTEFTLQEVE